MPAASFTTDDVAATSKMSIYDAIAAVAAVAAVAARRILEEDAEAIENIDETPPPIHWAIYNDKPEMVELLLNHGANIERRDQDHDATPLVAAVVVRRKDIIPILMARGANPEDALDVALKGLAGGFEDFGLEREGYEETVVLPALRILFCIFGQGLEREGYEEIVVLLRETGCGE